MNTKQATWFLLILLIVAAGCRKLSEEEKFDSYIRDIIGEISAVNIGSDIEWLEAMGTRFCLAGNRREVAVDIMNRLKEYGYSNAVLDSFYLERSWRDTYYSLWEYNVIASLQGQDFPDSLSILGAHYDNALREGDPFDITPGANDNASGVAAMLEIARVFKKENYHPSGTIMFVAFGAEELGLHGSLNYASKLAASSSRVKMMLNNDMIAYEPSSSSNNWLVNIINYPASVSLSRRAEVICDNFTRLSSFNDNTYQDYSDSYSFNYFGYPALFFESGSDDPNYHTLYDVALNLNYDYCAEVTRLCCTILMKMN